MLKLEINSNNSVEVTGINKITTIYGKDTYDTPKKDELLSYMEQNKNNIVYDIDNERSISRNYRLQLPSESTNTSSINNIISQNEQNMQQIPQDSAKTAQNGNMEQINENAENQQNINNNVLNGNTNQLKQQQINKGINYDDRND